MAVGPVMPTLGFLGWTALLVIVVEFSSVLELYQIDRQPFPKLLEVT